MVKKCKKKKVIFLITAMLVIILFFNINTSKAHDIDPDPPSPREFSYWDFEEGDVCKWIETFYLNDTLWDSNSYIFNISEITYEIGANKLLAVIIQDAANSCRSTIIYKLLL